MPAHTDILDSLLFLLVPFMVALGVRWPRLGQLAGAMGMALLATLLVDLTHQLPFPAAFPGAGPAVSDIKLALWWVGVWLVGCVLLAPPAAAGFLASLLVAPALSLVVFTTNAVAACNPYAHHDGIAGVALASGAEQVATLGVLAAVRLLHPDRPSPKPRHRPAARNPRGRSAPAKGVRRGARSGHPRGGRRRRRRHRRPERDPARTDPPR